MTDEEMMRLLVAFALLSRRRELFAKGGDAT